MAKEERDINNSIYILKVIKNDYHLQDRCFQSSLSRGIEALKQEQSFLDAGYKNEEVDFYIGGRRFRVREVAQ